MPKSNYRIVKVFITQRAKTQSNGIRRERTGRYDGTTVVNRAETRIMRRQEQWLSRLSCTVAGLGEARRGGALGEWPEVI